VLKKSCFTREHICKWSTWYLYAFTAGYIRWKILYIHHVPDRTFAAAGPQVWNMGCHTASSGGYWRHFYSDIEATAPNRNILTYLLTCRTVQAVVLHQHRKGHLPYNKYSGSISLSHVHTSKLNPTQLHFAVNLSFPHTRCPLCMNCWQPL